MPSPCGAGCGRGPSLSPPSVDLRLPPRRPHPASLAVASLLLCVVGPPAWSASQASGATAIIGPESLAAMPGVLLIQVGWDVERAYRRAHIPGAIYLDTNRIERPPLWKFVSDADLERALLALGVTRTTRVVVYGMPTMAATRAALALLYAGVEDVRLLDGGLETWRASGRPIETGFNKPTPAASFGAPFPGRPDLIVHAADVRRALDDPGSVVVSVRSLREQLGEASGYLDFEARGRIRGDVWGGGGSDANHMEDYENPDGTLKSAGIAAGRWSRAGILPEKRVIFYCGTGWRASLAFWDAWALGWPRISVYDPGWYEWGRDPANPIATGPLQVPESR
jgi:molybdopterin synthase sulfurtransferase